MSNSPTAVENSAEHFGAFTMISSIPDNSSLPWPCFQMKAHGEAAFLGLGLGLLQGKMRY